MRVPGPWLLYVACIYKVQEKEFGDSGHSSEWLCILTGRLGLGKNLFTENVLSHSVSDFNYMHAKLCIGLRW